jgi:hypothetical protein
LLSLVAKTLTPLTCTVHIYLTVGVRLAHAHLD